MSLTPTTVKNWLLTLPCVKDGRVFIDVRGVYPVAHINDGRMTRASVIRQKSDMTWFVVEYLD